MKKRKVPPRTPGKRSASDADLFAREMADVVRLEPDPRGRVRAAPAISPPPHPSPAPARDGDDGELDDAFAAPGVDRREIRKIRRGEHAVGDRRGLHSEGSVPILKTRVRECLRADRSVLAYADAPRSDGGAGAVYVLLRK